VSPRSEEFARLARERLAAARHSIDAGDFSVSVSVAYYAMLYAARAALSERDLNAKTHGGTWSLFSEHLVKDGPLDPELSAKARRIERLRYEADYDAAAFDRETAGSVLDDAERFVDTVLAALD
jgi:uncharacterized protein (UPF0332 family)